MRFRLFNAAIAGLFLLAPVGGFAETLGVKTATPVKFVGKARPDYIAVCGNGIPDPGEACDDGKQCANGTQCTSNADCGGGQWDTQQVGVDASCATRNGDGCSSDCLTRFQSQQARYCGNGVIDPGEACEPPNTAGCLSDCQRSISAQAVPSKGLVLKNVGGILLPHSSECGNGVKESGEECDDGNTENGDGCSVFCADETPGTVCGNGVLEAGEGCEDGNTVSGDGCSASCTLEPPPVCGNGIVESGEECDDGNNAGGDGCNPNCKKTGP